MTIVEITGSTGRTYSLTTQGGRATGCSCPAARFRGPGCKHQTDYNNATDIVAPESRQVPRATPATRAVSYGRLLTPSAATAFSDPLAFIDDDAA